MKLILPSLVLKRVLIIAPLFVFHNQVFSQNLIVNGDFNSNLDNWNVSTTNCPAVASNTWQYYAAGLEPSFPAIWEGTAFLKNKISNNEYDYLVISQELTGLIPSFGNKIELSMDVLIGESNNVNASNAPAQYMGDNLTLEIWLGGIRYARVRTPSGWNSPLGNDFGRCLVDYFNGASSVNYVGGNSMKNVSDSYVVGQAPYLYPGMNSGWDISIPWECEQLSNATLEIKVISSAFLNKEITDTRGMTYAQTCATNDYSNIDNIAIDNITAKNKMVPATPDLVKNNLTSTNCGQVFFNLSEAVVLPTCPIANDQSVEYLFFYDANCTLSISDPANYETVNNEQTVYVVLANKVLDPNFRVKSTVIKQLKVTRNTLNTAGSIGSPFELCSNTSTTEISNFVSASTVNGATLTYFWEKSINSPDGVYNPAAGNNTALNYTPSGLTTPNEVVTNYYFRRRATSTLNNLSCILNTQPVEVIVKPCAPTSINSSIEYFDNPGGNNFITVPNTLFSGKASVGTITNVKIPRFPTNIVKMTIATNSPNGRIAVTTVYCSNPAVEGCVGTQFPTGGVTLPTNLAGNIINTEISIDPLNGSFLTEIPFLIIDSRSFVSTEGKASILFGNNGPLAVNLLKFEAIANNTNVELTWKTENEEEFSHFEIEASKNNLKFNKIGKITTNEANEYKFHSKDLSSGIWYFRLKMIDLDGTFDYSSIKSAEIANNFNKILVKQNPSKEFIKLDMKVEKGLYNFHLLDASGKTVFFESKTIAESEVNYQLNRKPLEAGYYFLKITNEASKFIETKKIIIE